MKQRTAVFPVSISTLILILVAVAVSLGGCQPSTSAPAKLSQADKAAAAANSIVFTDNAEIANIKRRVELTSKPGLLGYIVLFGQGGQSVIGKVTSAGKRLTPPYAINTFHNGNGGTSGIQVPSPSDEGTWGSGDSYIYYWTPDGSYRQWSGEYLYSDKPIRLNVQPIAVSVIPAGAAQ